MILPNTTVLRASMTKATRFLQSNSHTIKTVVAMIGAAWACKEFYEAFPEAQRLKEEATKNKGKELTKVETILAVLPAFLEPAAFLALTEWFIFWAHKDAAGKVMVAAAAAKYYKDNAEKFEQKAEEILGEKKVKSIHEAISQDEVNNTDPKIFESIPKGEDGKYWIKEDAAGHWFRDTREHVDHSLAVCATTLAAAKYEGDDVPYSDFLCQIDVDTDNLISEILIFDPKKLGKMTDTTGIWDYCEGPDGKPAAILRTSELVETMFR